VLRKGDIESLIIYLRGELDQVQQAIFALERMARTRRADAVTVAKRPIGSERAPVGRAGKGWTHHRRAG
jgi:hypothetical protein